ncbi:neuronal growth regulator 1-like isoform X2 [Anopheles albimanus]|uniref:neuronal growth regulator 1-like isoform X2 n=1 Tax=Anopheles albimanus TaxID=7167 RepID=UPI0016419FBB|nr:neuronal growth regulator 1-like isoform X2 [Anopheles albimanus]
MMHRRRSVEAARPLALLLMVLMIGTIVESLPQSSVSVSKEQRSKQAEAVEAAGDDYDDYDDGEDEDAPSQERTQISDNTLLGTKLLTKNYIEKAPPGEQVALRCEVANPTNSTIIIWYKKNQPIFQHRSKLTSDQRFKLLDDFALQIDGVQLSDEGDYSCQLLPSNSSVKIELQILTPPRNVHIMHGSKILNETVELNQRDRKFVLFCSATGHPTPQIVWSYRGRHLDEEYSRQIGIVPRKEFIEIHEVHPKHAGDYECLAQNGVGEPISRTVTVVVKAQPMNDSTELEDELDDESNSTAPLEKGKPILHKHASYINTAIGENVEMVCLYDSNPAARKIQWFRDDEAIQNGPRTTIVNDHHGHHDRTRLTVKNIQQKDLVSYFCKIENDMGETNGKTIVGLVPTGAHLLHSNYSDGLLHTWWKIHSIQPLSEVQVFYRGENAKYMIVNAESSDQEQGYDGFTWTIRKSIRLPEGHWIMTARARNTEGWSNSESIAHPVQIPSRSTIAKDSNSIQLSSIGGAGGSSSAHGRLPLPIASVLLLASILLSLKSLMY